VLIALLLALAVDQPNAVDTASVAAASAPTVAAVPAPDSAAGAPDSTAPAAPQQVSTPGILRLPKTTEQTDTAQKALRFVWRDHPSLRAGRNFRLDFAAKFQLDARKPGDEPVDFPTWELHRARIGVEGELFRKIQFQVEREFTERELNDPSRESTKTAWKDVFVEANIATEFQVRVGRFKIPYGLDITSGETDLDFVYRSLGGSYLSPSRDTGAMVHGRLFKRKLNYAFGGFEHDGDNSRSAKIAGGDLTFAGRVTVQPMGDNVEIGGSFATTDVSDESLQPNGLRGRTVVSQFTWFDPVFVKGSRRRYGADLDWASGPFGARAEYMFVTDQRDGQGLGQFSDLSNARGRAYYVLGTWVLTGEKKSRPVEARNGGIGRGGVGAVEHAARFDALKFDSKKGIDTPFRNSRAETIFPNEDKVLTLGVNYYVNRFGKIQFNAIRERITDADATRNPILDGSSFWSAVVRFQLAL
jgi:phosphate-selective porin OprO/OprP